MFPDWIIAGVPKAGTSSLFEWLTAHPEVSGPAEKETYYFTDPGTHMFPKRSFHTHGLRGYEKIFARCNDNARILIEATPGYLYSRTARDVLPNLPNQPRFIFMLREPVEQVKSLYRYFQENWNWIPREMTFADFVRDIKQGRAQFRGNELAAHALENADYAPHLIRWRQACRQDRMHVFLFEEMVRDNQNFMRSLATKMEIDPTFYDDYDFPAANESYVVRSRFVHEVNIHLRGLIPKGPLFRALRSLYRTANTRKAENGGVLDDGVERLLSERYLPGLEVLEREFGLDLTGWRQVLTARLASGAKIASAGSSVSAWLAPNRGCRNA